jgi:hypothetical protein
MGIKAYYFAIMVLARFVIWLALLDDKIQTRNLGRPNFVRYYRNMKLSMIVCHSNK